mmetsp:Transcript_54587/g.153286  ORF Transcript_54587/g.153286 Transcript_54587/m.153286 type:complete len:275 (+) Transcript_54587:662-1486(+)
MVRQDHDAALVLGVAEVDNAPEPMQHLLWNGRVGLPRKDVASPIRGCQVAEPARVQGDDAPRVGLPAGVRGALPRAGEACHVQAAETADEVVIAGEGKGRDPACGERNSLQPNIPRSPGEVRHVLVNGAGVVHIAEVQRHLRVGRSREPCHGARDASPGAPVREGGDGEARGRDGATLRGVPQGPARGEVEHARDPEGRLVGPEGVQRPHLRPRRLIDPRLGVEPTRVQELLHLVSAVLFPTLRGAGNRRRADARRYLGTLALLVPRAPPATAE